jgi:transglutaminase-like putative cysteine protease
VGRPFRVWRGFLCLSLTLSLESSADAQRERRFVFTYEAVARDLPASAKRVEVWLPAPPDTREQRVLDMKITSPVEGAVRQERVYGNRVWHASAGPPPDGALRVTQRLEVVRREQRTDWGEKHADLAVPENLGLFLRPDRLAPVTARFEEMAREETQGRDGVVAQARALYDFVLGRMTYDKSGDGWGRGDANYACDVGRGNCTDFHSLFMALSRSVKTPVRFWIGFPLPPERGEGRVAGYHCWAEFWAPGAGWAPVDISEADKHPEKAEYFFGNLDENRLVFSLGRDLVLNPPQQGPPINFFIYPYVEVDGTPWERVDCRFTYRDLP